MAAHETEALHWITEPMTLLAATHPFPSYPLDFAWIRLVFFAARPSPVGPLQYVPYFIRCWFSQTDAAAKDSGIWELIVTLAIIADLRSLSVARNQWLLHVIASVFRSHVLFQHHCELGIELEQGVLASGLTIASFALPSEDSDSLGMFLGGFVGLWCSFIIWHCNDVL